MYNDGHPRRVYIIVGRIIVIKGVKIITIDYNATCGNIQREGNSSFGSYQGLIEFAEG